MNIALVFQGDVDDSAVMGIHFRQSDGFPPATDLFCSVEGLLTENIILAVLFIEGAFAAASAGTAFQEEPPQAATRLRDDLLQMTIFALS